MMLPLSEPVWRSLPCNLSSFPMRFNTVLLVACAVLVTLAISMVLQRERKIQTMA